MKKRGLNAGWLILVFVVGLSLLLYPSISNYINELHGSRAISEYSEAVSNLKAEQYTEMMEDARAYNRTLNRRANVYQLGDEQALSYQKLLNVDGSGIMGYIEIPAITVSLPIYHGTDDTVLQRAVGHLEWTSLPVGGESTHCVLSGHRGLPSAKLFTNLDKLVVGDVFMIRVLNEVLTYEVDQILTVLPSELDWITALWSHARRMVSIPTGCWSGGIALRTLRRRKPFMSWLKPCKSSRWSSRPLSAFLC